eukprot:SAG22_NODE_38_length_26325_cov_107.302067_30_plen_227_part_00
MYLGEATLVFSFKGSDHCLSFCFSAFPCGSTALTADRCNQRSPRTSSGRSRATTPWPRRSSPGKALPLPCVSTVFRSKTVPFRAVCLAQHTLSAKPNIFTSFCTNTGDDTMPFLPISGWDQLKKVSQRQTARKGRVLDFDRKTAETQGKGSVFWLTCSSWFLSFFTAVHCLFTASACLSLRQRSSLFSLPFTAFSLRLSAFPCGSTVLTKGHLLLADARDPAGRAQ